jgi:hypothetical protein
LANRPDRADSSLPVLLQRCLSHLRRADRIPEETASEVFSRVSSASPDEIEAGLQWRQHLEPTLRKLGQLADRKAATFGELLRAVGSLPPMAERGLRSTLMSDTRLFDRLFLQRIWKEYLPVLNRAAHGRVTRRECLQLRRDFLERKLLRDLLASVWPAMH